MAIIPAPGESYTIRRQVFRIFGAAFHIYDKKGQLAGYCKQKAFKLREDIRIYADESQSTELLRIAARSIIDFSSTFDVALGSGEPLGSLRRKGLKSSFVRDEWLIFNAEGQQIGLLQEEGSFMPLLRRYVEFVSILSPQTYSITDTAGRRLGRLRQHFNLFIYRLGVTVDPEADQAGMDDLFILAMGCVVAAIEGQQQSD